jgi:hypothetical protein
LQTNGDQIRTDRAGFLREDSPSSQKSCGRTATPVQLLRENGRVTLSGKRRSCGTTPGSLLREEPRLRCKKTKVWTDADPAPAHEHFIYLIYTPTMTNESTHVPSEVQTPRGSSRPTHPHRSDRTSRKGRSGSPLLTRALADIKEMISRRREISTNLLTNTTTEPTHKI